MAVVTAKTPKQAAGPTCSAETRWMRAALLEAKKAGAKNEVPIGCVIVKDGKIISRGHNQTEGRQDPTAHAELLAIKKAARRLGSWRLDGCAVYVTVAPCSMCRGALSRARVEQLYWAAPDPKAACGKNPEKPPQEEGGLLAEEAGALLGQFFQGLR